MKKGEKEERRKRGKEEERKEKESKQVKEGKEEGERLPKIPVAETKLPHNSWKYRKGLICRRDFNKRHTVLSHNVITRELCLISCINEGAP